MVKKWLIGIILIIPLLGISQLNGIWEVIEVKVGEETMTPQSKWFEFRIDGSLYGGNGGVINTRGTHKVDNQQVYILNERGEDDGYGPFAVVDKSDSSMLWSRIEEGSEVKIVLRSIETIPLAPWDEIVGQWKVEEKEEGYLFRWDKFFIHNYGEERKWGIWHMHAHKPELRLMYFEEGKEDE